MKANTIYILQSIGFFLQMINVGLAGEIHSVVWSVILSAFVGSFQLYLQHAGIKLPVVPQIEKK